MERIAASQFEHDLLHLIADWESVKVSEKREIIKWKVVQSGSKTVKAKLSSARQRL